MYTSSVPCSRNYVNIDVFSGPVLEKYHNIGFLPCFREASFCYARSVGLKCG